MASMVKYKPGTDRRAEQGSRAAGQAVAIYIYRMGFKIEALEVCLDPKTENAAVRYST